MRAIWSGAISFGLVNIPVRLYSASGEAALNFDMLAKKELSPIKYKRIAVSDEREVPYNDIVKGYEITKGNYVIMEDEDFEKAAAEKSKAIEITDFVNESEIDPIYFEKPYFLEPDKNATKPYALLREALKESGKVGIAKFVLRNREKLAVIKGMGDVLLLNQIRYKEDLRDYNDLNLPAEKSVTQKEIDLALKLIDQLSDEFKPEKFSDNYVNNLKKVIDAKAEGKTISFNVKEAEPTRTKDLMETLMASLKEDSKTKKPASRPPVSKSKTTKTKSTGSKTKKSK